MCWQHDSTLHHRLADTALKKTNGTLELIYVNQNRIMLLLLHRVVDPTIQKLIDDKWSKTMYTFLENVTEIIEHQVNLDTYFTILIFI